MTIITQCKIRVTKYTSAKHQSDHTTMLYIAIRIWHVVTVLGFHSITVQLYPFLLCLNWKGIV